MIFNEQIGELKLNQTAVRRLNDQKINCSMFADKFFSICGDDQKLRHVTVKGD